MMRSLIARILAGPLPRTALAAIGFCLIFPSAASAQMTTGADMPGYAAAFRLTENDKSKDYAVEEISVTAGAAAKVNVLWPGDSAALTLHFTNKTQQRIKAPGRIELVSYKTSVPAGDVWVPHVSKLNDESATPVEIDLPPSGAQDVVVKPRIPEKFGGYLVLVDIEGHGRVFAAALVRTVKPDIGRVQFPTYALDTTWDEFMNEGVFELFERLGVKGMRMGGAYNPPDTPEYGKATALLDQYMQWARKHDVTVMLTLGDGDSTKMQPLGRPRPWLSPDGKMLDTKDDRAWLPAYDDDFQSWVQKTTTRYGWPGGNLNAVELWNEPWESISISGWGADIERYRDIFTHMALGVEAARQKAGVKVLIGGTCSSTNTRDKLFPDGDNHFLKWLDFVSIHYQALAADPAIVPEWMNRKGPYGPVRVWDTESWIANSEDRVAGVIASMRAQGQSRTAGIFDGNVYDSKNIKVGDQVYPVVQAWSPAAAVAATQKFIGQRRFRKLLFKNGLPWVFVFDGANEAGDSDDGTVVVVGDLRQIYEPERTLFRSVDVAPHASLRLSARAGAIRLFDFYGNPVETEKGEIEVPLNGLGYFLRTDGSQGSFAKLLSTLEHARVEGYSPVEIVAHDLTAPLSQHPKLRVTLTNVLNRSVAGKMVAKIGGAQLRPETISVALAPGEARTVEFEVASESPVASNSYKLTADFDAGVDGRARRNEDIHVNYIARRSINVDGDLADWEGVLPQALPETTVGASLTEEAWLPFKDFSKASPSGLAVTYLAYDDQNFYFAARIADSTLDPGMVRFETRDDDSYFYPDSSAGRDGATLEWPKGVRHYSYRKNFDIPSGSGEHDNVQIAFNVIDKKPWLPAPPGVMPRFITYWDSDYEFALNQVAPQYGGGAEIWRLLAPGVPRKHFFPRQPKAPIDGGPVKNGKLVMRRVGNTRIVEAAIPWTEIPEVHKRIVAGETIKFSCRVNDDKGPAHELAAGRSVSKWNSLTFHDEWQNHWANELEFGAER